MLNSEVEKGSAYDIFTDASDVGAAGFIKNSHLVMFKTWLKLEAGKNSTQREIKAVELCLLSFKDVIQVLHWKCLISKTSVLECNLVCDKCSNCYSSLTFHLKPKTYILS
jgi:hypothetical protein